MESGLTADEVGLLGLNESVEMRTNALLGSPGHTVNVALSSPDNCLARSAALC